LRTDAIAVVTLDSSEVVVNILAEDVADVLAGLLLHDQVGVQEHRLAEKLALDVRRRDAGQKVKLGLLPLVHAARRPELVDIQGPLCTLAEACLHYLVRPTPKLR